MIVRARAPLRISFGGGGTDVPPYPAKHGGVVLSAAIDRYAYCTVSEGKSGSFRLQSRDLELEEVYPDLIGVRYNGRLDLAKAVIRTLSTPHSKKFELSLFSEAPPGSGLGSSSALMVSIIRAVSEYLGRSMSRYSLAELAYQLERVELNIKGGYQDQYASTFGGFNFIEFTDKVTVNQLRVSEEVLQELQAILVLIDTGKSRLSSNILSRQIASYVSEDSTIMENLAKIKALTFDMKTALLRGNLSEFGRLIGEEWKCKKMLDKFISNKSIDNLYDGVVEHGALGGKVLGAGNGGHMIFMVPFDCKKEVIKYLSSRGFSQIPFGLDNRGAVAWRVDDSGVLI